MVQIIHYVSSIRHPTIQSFRVAVLNSEEEGNQIILMETPTKFIEVFFSYAHEDEAFLKDLEKHLQNLKRQGLISTWYDRDIEAGKGWEEEIDRHLNTADIIVLLVSPDYMASDYCYSIEMKRAIERHERGEARVVPVLLR